MPEVGVKLNIARPPASGAGSSEPHDTTTKAVTAKDKKGIRIQGIRYKGKLAANLNKKDLDIEVKF
jgi:hypothetical protein